MTCALLILSIWIHCASGFIFLFFFLWLPIFSAAITICFSHLFLFLSDQSDSQSVNTIVTHPTSSSMVNNDHPTKLYVFLAKRKIPSCLYLCYCWLGKWTVSNRNAFYDVNSNKKVNIDRLMVLYPYTLLDISNISVYIYGEHIVIIWIENANKHLL